MSHTGRGYLGHPLEREAASGPAGVELMRHTSRVKHARHGFDERAVEGKRKIRKPLGHVRTGQLQLLPAVHLPPLNPVVCRRPYQVKPEGWAI